MTSGLRRARPWVAGVTLAVIACAGSFWVGAGVTSPWEQARENAATPVVASASVVAGELVPEVTPVAGVIRLGHSVAVTVDGPREGTRAVVTRHRVAAGDRVGSGTVLVEVADRPLIALGIPFPLFRDLGFEDRGSDVRALQEAMTEQGWYRGRVDGVFGTGTQEAVRRMYRSIGVSPPETREDDAAALAEAHRALAELVEQGDQATQDAVAQARARVAAAAGRASTWLPAAEVVACEGEASVVSVAPVGTVLGADTAAVELRVGAPTATARATMSQVEAFEVGSPVTVSSVGEDADPYGATVLSIGEFTDGHDDVPPGYDVTVGLVDVPSLADGDHVTIRPNEAGVAARGLLVPLAAIRERSGQLYVQVLDGDPTRVPVTTHQAPVELLVSRDGMAVVAGSELSAGDRVAVG